MNQAYNKGDLYLNHKGNLNGSIIDFKFFPHTLSKDDIQNIINEKPVIQDDDPNFSMEIDKEHQHELQFVHTHKYESEHDEHQHSLEQNNVNTDYYTDN